MGHRPDRRTGRILRGVGQGEVPRERSNPALPHRGIAFGPIDGLVDAAQAAGVGASQDHQYRLDRAGSTTAARAVWRTFRPARRYSCPTDGRSAWGAADPRAGWPRRLRRRFPTRRRSAARRSPLRPKPVSASTITGISTLRVSRVACSTSSVSVNSPTSGKASAPAENAAPDKYRAGKPASSIIRPTSALNAPGIISVESSAASRSFWPGRASGMRLVPGCVFCPGQKYRAAPPGSGKGLSCCHT